MPILIFCVGYSKHFKCKLKYSCNNNNEFGGKNKAMVYMYRIDHHHLIKRSMLLHVHIITKILPMNFKTNKIHTLLEFICL